MFKFGKFILLSVIIFLTACSTVKQGFTNQKKNGSDEFLVEKKSPLIMPPDYNELPIPNSEKKQNNNKETKIKDLITNKNVNNANSDNKIKTNQNFEESLLEKIKKN